jgi:hypothetical protein
VGDIAKENIPKILAKESRKNSSTLRLLRGGGGGVIGWSFTMFEKDNRKDLK